MIIKTLFIYLTLVFSSAFKTSQLVDNTCKVVFNKQQGEVFLDSTSSGLNFQIKDSYRNEKLKIESEKLKLRSTFHLISDPKEKELFLDSASLIFTNLLLNNIIPHWYGTPWNFEGHTSVPNQGNIACGYFVSTTLNHMGLNLNRYHLARQGPLNEAKSLAIDSSLALVFSSENSEIKNVFFSAFSNGLYFIGLDSHVGYLYVYKEQAFFIHSNYIENRVMIEPIELSKAFKSRSFIITKITGNQALVKKWILGSEISVYKS